MQHRIRTESLSAFKSAGEKLLPLSVKVICLWEEEGDEQTSIHCKIRLFTHKYQIQRQMRGSLVYVSKAFDHATFSTFKKKQQHQKS